MGPRQQRVLIAIAIIGGVVVWWTAHELFPYLSANHDEGVYLQQAAMLLEGKLWLTSPVPGAFRPWFFVLDGSRLYPKYTPMTALMFAPGVAIGHPRLILGMIGAGIVWLIGSITAEAFDGPTGVLAGAITVVTPFFLFVTATFLSYAPTTLLTLTFALAYIRTFRRGTQYAPIAGLAIGFAFFARPFTAVVFAVPFIFHALLVIYRALARRELRSSISIRLIVVGLGGLSGVCLTLVYNAVVTHDPLTFPYAAFAPHDGLGFGRRKLLGYSIEYTPALALRVTLQSLFELVTRWSAGGPIGAVLGAIGAYTTLMNADGSDDQPLSDRTVQRLLLGVGGSVIVLEGYFWGVRNALGAIENPLEGFAAIFGPFYHFDLLVVLSAFSAAALMWIVRTVRPRVRRSYTPEQYRAIGAVVLIVATPVAGSISHDQYERVWSHHQNVTDDRATLNAPFERRSVQNAIVFMPPVQGPWLSHPFEFQRNGGALKEGPTVFAQRRGPRMNFDVLDAFPNRSPYRYTFQGTWPSNVTPVLLEESVHESEGFQFRTRVQARGRLSSVSLRLRQGQIYRAYSIENQSLRESISSTIRVTNRSVELVAVDGNNLTNETQSRRPQPISGAVGRADFLPGSGQTAYTLTDGTRIVLSIDIKRPDGTHVTYHQWIDVDPQPESDTVRFLWPGTQRVCTNESTCGWNGTYLPQTEEAFAPTVDMNTTWEPIENPGG
ncbi:ArnT family glycosyltransferase [Halocatena halophila]|uniref:ArnT family glycosyltransferase n=1 Tax=Halocatena halophila TaxID=2814576 RepID=UPI002ED1BDD8